MINIPKGTKDVVPAEAYKWHYVEEKIREVAREFCIGEIRTPVFEHTELFLRGVGDTTDIVNKEMYTFNDKGGRSITLKPEGTAGVARAFIENGLGENPQPTKMYYITPVFRYERPQAGRLREHHQFGVEVYGSASPQADAEVILIARAMLGKVGISDLSLKINSIGCSECRAKYNKVLKEYFSAHIGEMCSTCRERLDKNPLRILDCKEEKCKQIAADAPVILDHLCDECREHHEKLCKALDAAGVSYVIDPHIVRGLDYYTRTVFEFVSNAIGAQGTVCGGGRYDGLVEQVGGKSTPAAGFGMGIERLLMVMQNVGVQIPPEKRPDVYIAPLCDRGCDVALGLACRLREKGFAVEREISGRSLKAQMKYAAKIGAKKVVFIGEDEIEKGIYTVKNMQDSTSLAMTEEELTEALK